MSNTEPEFYLFNLDTMHTSTMSWKTYTGAAGNANKDEIVSTLDGIEWAKLHPEWCEERLETGASTLTRHGESK